MSNKDRIIQISKKLKLSHIGSCLSVLPVLEEIYAMKQPHDIVILDNAHAHLAHLVVKADKVGIIETDDLCNGLEGIIERYGIHCDRKAGCDASGGSLGHGIGIGIGYALADKKRTVYVIVSDGSMMEGSNWEALRIMGDRRMKNIKIHTNFNGYSAVAKVDVNVLIDRMSSFVKNYQVVYHITNNGLERLDGIKGHYEVL